MLPLRSPFHALVLGCLLALGLVACGDDDGAAPAPTRGAGVAQPLVEGPVTGGSGAPFVAASLFDLAEVGYRQDEYFLTGTATSYRNVGPLGVDGTWTVEPAASADYKTRIVVHRPIDPRRFNGTVIVEWLNVSGGLDAAADWIMAHTEFTRSGYAWVGVSAQYIGIEGGTPLLPSLTPMPLKTIDPVRYASLAHPGDSFSYDIFAQAAQAVLRPRGVDPLDGLHPELLLAAGESQSAFRMTVYVNALHPRDDIFDGFFIHSRGTLLPTTLSDPPQAAVATPPMTRIRTDLNVPVFTFQTENDYSFLAYAPARQPDSDTFRLWDVAGTAHADTYTTLVGLNDRGGSPDAAALVLTRQPRPEAPECAKPINSGPHHWVLKAAFDALHRWVRDGVPPPIAPRFELAGTRLVRDARGIVAGGIRTPHVDVPLAILSGDGQPEPIYCMLFGTTTPFSADELTALYPTQADYVSAFNASTDAAVAAGFLLPADAALMKAHATTVTW